MRAIARRAIEGLLASSHVRSLALGRVRGRALVLAYHNIVPDGLPPVGDRSLHLPVSVFRAQLDALTEETDIVPLPELMAGAPSRRCRAAITFDDAYAGAVELALPELARRRIPATLFVAPGCLGADGFWWDRYAGPSGEWASGERDVLLTRFHGAEEQVRTRARDTGWHATEPPAWLRVAREDQVLAAATAPGLTLGAHSWSHPNLASLDPADLGPELDRPLAWLKQHAERALPWLAYPYGLSSPSVATAARAAGYEAALLVTGGWLPKRIEDRFSLPRWNVPAGISLAGFRLRLAGLFCR